MSDTGAGGGDEQSSGAEQFDAVSDEEVSLDDFPPDKPWGAEAYGAGGADAQDGFAERTAREIPDRPEVADDPVGALTDVDDPFEDDVTGESIAEIGDEAGLLSAEEAAMHSYSPEEAVDHGLDPDGPLDDGYLEGT